MFENVPEQRRKTMSRIRSRDTSIEVALRRALYQRGYRYRKNYRALPGSPDICLTKYKVAIFCDGEFFHGKDWASLRQRVSKGNNGEYWERKIQRNIDRDREADKSLKALGWTVLHFWGKEIQGGTEECVRAVEEAVFERAVPHGERQAAVGPCPPSVEGTHAEGACDEGMRQGEWTRERQGSFRTRSQG